MIFPKKLCVFFECAMRSKSDEVAKEKGHQEVMSRRSGSKRSNSRGRRTTSSAGCSYCCCSWASSRQEIIVCSMAGLSAVSVADCLVCSAFLSPVSPFPLLSAAIAVAGSDASIKSRRTARRFEWGMQTHRRRRLTIATVVIIKPQHTPTHTLIQVLSLDKLFGYFEIQFYAICANRD